MKRVFASLAALAVGLAASTALAQTTQPATDHPPMTLYCVGYAHLDTQWRWSYPQVIAEFLRKTMEDNFALFEKYPDYLFNFTGANRYMMMKEYYPEDYAKLKQYIAQGRWFPAGSSMEEGDVDMPDGEAIIRQVLYGNEFFRHEFNKASDEFMLPDCFGFQASLPSLLAHCGIKGFSTQKLTWGSAVGIPFNVGVWEGPDGRSVVAALNPGSYAAKLTTDLSSDPVWVKRLEEDGKKTGVYVDYRYYGTGDQGGGVGDASCQWLEKSVHGSGPVHVISATADQMFKDLTPEQVAKLPRYAGDLLLTNHSTGSLSSEAFVKRCNRKLEQLADAAERASVAADAIGDAPYPRQKIFDAWRLLLGAHFHDTMAGTALPKSYEYTWNNLVLALNEFAAVDTDAVGGIAATMDTRATGTPLLVYNPLSVDRDDVATATVPLQGDSASVVGPDGKTVPAQVIGHDGDKATVLFRAQAPAIGFAVYDVRPGAAEQQGGTGELSVTPTTLENQRLKVTIDSNGDIASILDKTTGQENLTAPARLEFLHEKPKQYPAWNMDWEDRSAAPLGYVDGPAEVKVVESGPVRVALEVTRHSRNSTFVQKISLDSGGDRVNVECHIDWNARACSLEAVFPLAAGSPMASYESQSAAVQRGNNNPKKFEVPQQQWLDLTDATGKFGTAILNDCKYGSDKPDDHTIRLTLLYTPGVGREYQDQATQDVGRHEILYAIQPHAGGYVQGDVPWQAAMLNQPPQTFAVAPHEGHDKQMSLAQTSDRAVAISAIKKAEEGDEIIVRLKELTGQPAKSVTVSFATPIASAREVDGQEREIGPATVDGGKLTTDLPQFGLRAFAVRLQPATVTAPPPQSEPIALQYDLDAISNRSNYHDGAFNSAGQTYPAEAWPASLDNAGIHYTLGSAADGQNNALVCHGQTLTLPAGCTRVYLLASAVNGDQSATFKVGDRAIDQTVQNWTGYIGQWDNRIWQGIIPALSFKWTNRFVGLQPGFIKRDQVAWFSPVIHDPDKGIEYYKFSYLFQYALDVPAGATALTLPDNANVRIFAATAAKGTHDDLTPARPLYDTLADHKTMPTFGEAPAARASS